MIYISTVLLKDEKGEFVFRAYGKTPRVAIQKLYQLLDECKIAALHHSVVIETKKL